MATIDLATRSGTARPSLFKAVGSPYVVEVTVDLADAVTAKGSALAANDVIEALDLPAGTVVLSAGMRVDEAMTGTSTDATVDFGITGGDVDKFVDGFDIDGASVGDYAPIAAGAASAQLVTADDTADILIVTQTGTLLTGKLSVWAVLVDVTDKNSNPGRAMIGS